MSDWMGAEISLGIGSIALGMLQGRLCAWVACWLPNLLEHQWQHGARELLGLVLNKHPAPNYPEYPEQKSGSYRSAALCFRDGHRRRPTTG